MGMLTTSDIRWFPMRVTYNREMKIKECFDELGMECFIPMCYDLSASDIIEKKVLVPAIHNLIFVHSSQAAITKLKMERRAFFPIRYMMKRQGEGGGILTVPDKEMENFMRVASVDDDSVFYLDYNDYINKIGQRVRITAGRFKDVVGVIKRVKRNKHVVVQIEGIVAVAITYIPAEFLEEIG